VRIIGVCNGNNETVVWAHANGYDSGKGIGMKSNDLAGSYCCSDCHDVYDRRVRPKGIFYDQVMIDFYAGHMRSLQILVDEGIIKL